MKAYTYVIAGNGITGLSAAEEIRKNDPEGSILMISRERHLTYYRVKLSHYINEDFKDSDILLHEKKWYEDRKIDVLLESEIQKIDFKESVVILDAEKIKYQKLLLATGSSPFVPPAKGLNQTGVFSFRTLDDLRTVQHYFRKVDRVAVVGGGILGVEAAWAVHELGKSVQIVEFVPHLLNRQLDDELSDEFASRLEKEGVEIYTGAGAEEIKGEEHVESVKVSDGREFKTDAVLFSCGIRSNTGLAKDSLVEVSRGIVVDNRMKTSVANVYAAGDVAELNGVTLGLWTAGMAQGKVAGKNMAGVRTEYQLEKPATMLNLNDIRIFSVGNASSELFALETPTGRDDGKIKLFFQEERLAGGVLVSDTRYMLDLKRAVFENRDCSEFIDQQMNALEIIEAIKKG